MIDMDTIYEVTEQKMTVEHDSCPSANNAAIIQNRHCCSKATLDLIISHKFDT